jgi:hypothetical protein
MGVRDELAKAITKGIRAFHSSPHDFEYGVVGAPAGALCAAFDPSQYEAAP